MPAHREPRAIALVAVGGIAGAPARYALTQVFPPKDGTFPAATFITNLAGCLLLGVLLEALARRGPDVGRRRSLRLLAGTGFCGTFTTYSTFTVDADQLLRHGRVGLAVTYVLGSVVLGLGATGVGIGIAARRARHSSGSGE